MSELVGKTLLGNKFVQDPKQDYIKIDGVSLGKSDKFGYKTDKPNGIGDLLDKLLLDNKAAVIVYDWDKKIAYIKTGFDLNDASDYSLKEKSTTFIKKSKVTEGQKKFFAGDKEPTNTVPDNKPDTSSTPDKVSTDTAPDNVLGSIRVNECVRLSSKDSTKFELNGMPFVPVGWNAFFLGLMSETDDYPTKAQITEIFEGARKLKATVIRSHTLGFSAKSKKALLDNKNNFNDKAWDVIDFAYKEAKRCSIKIIPVLVDGYDYYHGSYDSFTKPFGISKEQFYTNDSARQEFKKYLNTYLNHVNSYTGVAIKDAVEVAFLELGNELGNIRPKSKSIAIPTQEWIEDITRYIKSIDKKHLVLNCSDECLGSKQSNDFAVKELDVFQSHFYSRDFSRIKRDAKRSADVKRPYIIGEYDSKWSDDWFKDIEAIHNVRGSMAWSIYPHDNGKPTGKRMPHNDGFTFWCDTQSDDNVKKLLSMTNHFRRMQNLAEVKSISF